MANNQLCVNNGPYAVRTALGWSINGPTRDPDPDHNGPMRVSANRIVVSSNLEDQLRRFMDADFSEAHVQGDEKAPSVEDQGFLSIMEDTTIKQGSHYEMRLPLRNQTLSMPNNRASAAQRLRGIARKFQRDDSFKSKYADVVEDLFVKGYASPVPPGELDRDDGRVWYLPHHGVFHPRKGKLRVVFDCSAKYAGTSLNDQLLQGPDLMNSLLGVLLRFRQDQYAIMADLEAMFHQVQVRPSDRDLLRFLWWPNGDTAGPAKEYRMNVHLFGATSSPAVCVYALNRTARDNAQHHSQEAIQTVERSFYMDDCLKSLPSVDETIKITKELTDLCNKGGWRLTKWMSNSRDVLASIPDSEKAPAVKDIDLDREGIPAERALGVQWNPETDTLGFSVRVSDKPPTRRGILSIISSVYDPLGYAAPFLLPGKMIVQLLCKLGLGWDDQIPPDQLFRWQSWLEDLPKLDGFRLRRCLKPSGCESPKVSQFHHISDGSDSGYGTAS